MQLRCNGLVISLAVLILLFVFDAACVHLMSHFKCLRAYLKKE
ncbi:hypothetical protein RchiOBHm_Chr1g0347251 [Rosa chinensis]|uniref:Uncharacterized protein n=1 Tax=Rosa chinensis TaxID=74649 RepID=A0A2P6SF98_ROSCH|nr:hypothetical protein RchiOBHm_Chr1g0347251 [Rosa chinensis]